MPTMTGLSGNEIYCLSLKGMVPGDLVVGNSVFSMGFLGGLASAGRLIVGGEVSQITTVVHEGRLEAYKRMMAEARRHGGTGVTAVTSELRNFHGRAEFLSIASCVSAGSGHPGVAEFSTSANGQELYCQLDAGFRPIQFVFGNVAYSVGAAGGLLGGLKSLGRGEIKEFSDIFNQTRHLALRRITAEAVAVGANSVVGIETRIMNFKGAHEMLMLGTASHHPFLPDECGTNPVTSDLTNEEMWNMVSLGYLPQKLVLGTAVYSLGVVGGIKAAIAAFSRGEVSELTSMIYDAREHALGLIKDEASAVGADQVVGIKTYIHEHGSLLEFMAIGTAMRKIQGVAPLGPSLPPQAIIRDKDTWITGRFGNQPQSVGGGDLATGGAA